MDKKQFRISNGPMKRSGVKEHKEELEVKKMTRYPPSLNGINKNLP